ncbi:hypothetical protein E3O28_05475 [Cryobacterium sp. TMT2-14]|nr:hypothetical protein E3O28_05475 [Cryobacterium sp. TMT2-14]
MAFGLARHPLRCATRGRAAVPGPAAGEECLSVNVLRPASASRRRLGRPVMVFIHADHRRGSRPDPGGRGAAGAHAGCQPGHLLPDPGDRRGFPARAAARRLPSRDRAPGAADHRHQRAGGVAVPGPGGHPAEVADAYRGHLRPRPGEPARRDALRLREPAGETVVVGLRRGFRVLVSEPADRRLPLPGRAGLYVPVRPGPAA